MAYRHAVLHPVLLPVLLASVLPEGWAVRRAARLGYASNTRLVTLNRRVSMLSDLATEREPAAEVRATQTGPHILAQYRRVADLVRDEEIAVAVAQARTRAVGRVLTGISPGGTFVALWLLLGAGWIPLLSTTSAAVATSPAGSGNAWPWPAGCSATPRC